MKTIKATFYWQSSQLLSFLW